MKRFGIILLLLVALVFIILTIGKQSPGNQPAATNTTANSAKQDSMNLFWNYYRQATAYRHENHIKEALINYRKAIKLNPQHENTLYYMGNVAMMDGDYALADSCWRVLIKVNPSSARGFNQLGGLYFCPKAGPFWKPPQSKYYYSKAAELNMESPGTQVRLGEIALVSGDEPHAYDIFNQVIVSSPNNIPAQFLSAYLDWKHKRNAAARAHFILAIHAFPAAALQARKIDKQTSDQCAFLENRINELIPKYAVADTTVWMNHVLTAFSIRP